MKKFLLITCGLAIAAAIEAQIIHVPGDYPTIQQGIDAATNGDTVLVSDGTYYEQINFLGKKPLTVASEFLMDGDTNHIANTIIDGSQIPAGTVVPWSILSTRRILPLCFAGSLCNTAKGPILMAHILYGVVVAYL